MRFLPVGNEFAAFDGEADPIHGAHVGCLGQIRDRQVPDLKQRLGQAKAFEIMRVAILTGGVAQWNLAYQTVEKARSFANLCDLELEVNKTGPTRWNTLEVVDRSDRRFEIKITRCLYHELASSLGIPEITPVICQIDNAAFNAYLPDRVTFHRGGPGHRIADGKSECQFIWEVND